MHYYNEFDPHAAQWLRELISQGLIPEGVVDTRSIVDVKATELIGYVQCHFFAGIGGWPLALQLAGWSEDRPVWTGSCPCQPFSTAGKQLGQADERHLWPVFFSLIRECRPVTVFGEQVASAIGKGWLDGVSADLEGAGYACGATVLGAHSVGAPHIRQRLYWVADNDLRRREERSRTIAIQEAEQWESQSFAAELRGDAGGMADSRNDGREQSREGRVIRALSELQGETRRERSEQAFPSELCGGHGRVADSQREGLEGGRRNPAEQGGLQGNVPGSVRTAGRLADYQSERCGEARESIGRPEERNCVGCESGRLADSAGGQCEQRIRSQGNLFQRPSEHDAVNWASYRIAECRDGKFRRIPAESVLQCMADGVPQVVASGDPADGFPLAQKEGKAQWWNVGLKGFGNAIVPQVAAEFVAAYMEL